MERPEEVLLVTTCTGRKALCLAKCESSRIRLRQREGGCVFFDVFQLSASLYFQHNRIHSVELSKPQLSRRPVLPWKTTAPKNSRAICRVQKYVEVGSDSVEASEEAGKQRWRRARGHKRVWEARAVDVSRHEGCLVTTVYTLGGESIKPPRANSIASIDILNCVRFLIM